MKVGHARSKVNYSVVLICFMFICEKNTYDINNFKILRFLSSILKRERYKLNQIVLNHKLGDICHKAQKKFCFFL